MFLLAVSTKPNFKNKSMNFIIAYFNDPILILAYQFIKIFGQ